MDNIRNVIKNLFCYLPPQEILRGNITYYNITRELFEKLGNSYQKYYNHEELENMYSYMKDEFRWQDRRVTGILSTGGNTWNVFNALIAFDFHVLVEENNEPLCQYTQLLRWREMITALEEDLFITSFIAKKDTISGQKRHFFFWKPVIGHNNFALNRMLAQGAAENHFHLKGSAPLFHLSWISLMNDVVNPDFERQLRNFDGNTLQKIVAYDGEFRRESFSVMWRQAAVIRLFLLTVIRDDYLPIPLENEYVNGEVIRQICSDEDYRKVCCMYDFSDQPESNRYKFTKLQEILDERAVINLRKKIGEIWVSELLKNPEKMRDNIGVIQEIINQMKTRYRTLEADYLLGENSLKKNPDRGVNEVISGERWFMYEIFLEVYGRKKAVKVLEKYLNWFYAYLVIKTQIRMEMVQSNHNVGFNNFKRFQDRKDMFIDKTIYEPIYIKMAVQDTLYNQHIVSLEARIKPKDNAEDNRAAIRKYDDWACKGLTEAERQKLQRRYFYVYHFIKEADEKEIDETVARNNHVRDTVKKQACAIAIMRAKGYEEAKRVRGIDASASEIGCRPEVFAQAFRFLKNYVPKENEYSRWTDGNLMATYHVGEDFLDVVDGLRAIDEAIHFLNLRCGDRMGHALALGVEVEEWYRGKSGRILLNKQDYLDNLVWLYAKIRKYNIIEAVDAQNYIKKRFHEYFQELYLNNISTDKYEQVIKEAKQFFSEKEMEIAMHYNNTMSMDIDDYYDAWKLRGDDPYIYSRGFAQYIPYEADQWDIYAVDKMFPQNYAIRYSPEAAFLYYMYHFDKNVRKIGAEVVEVKVQESIIKAVTLVQKALQREIAELGIGIEANPSSNYLIGTFRRYDRHPIVSWYNLGLTYNDDKIKECPQIQVSINTDDQGVFATYLENEYAYMALALEKYKDKSGEKIYKRSCIMEWLESIRRIGINQSFQKSDVLYEVIREGDMGNGRTW